jgi:hypothetical protein
MNKKRATERFTHDDIFNMQGNCERNEEVFRYFQGLMTDPERKEFGKHIVECGHCTVLLSNLEESENGAENTILDSEKANEIFRRTRTKLRKQKSSLSVIDAFRGFHVPAYVNGLLTLMVLLLVYPAYRGFLLDDQVSNLQDELRMEKAKQRFPDPQESQEPAGQLVPSSEPVISPTEVYSIRTERDSETRTIRVVFHREQKAFTIVFSLPQESYESYVLEIVRADKTFWKREFPAIPSESSPLLSIHLQENFFKTGNYRLKISANRSGSAIQLSEYRLIISKQNP